jgi:dTDP-4-dehydrorhamnose reductase
MEPDSSRWLVVGANGYLGKELAAAVRRRGEVRGTSSRAGAAAVHLDLGRPAGFDYSTLQKKDIVLLAGSISAPDVCAKEHDRAWAVNVEGTSVFITRALDRGSRVVFFSSDTVYGEQTAPCDETQACQPRGAYAIMKHAVEEKFLGRPDFKSIRLSYVFSREDQFSRYLADCARRGATAEVFHPFFRAVIHRGDVVAGILALAREWEAFPEAAINFGGRQVISRPEFARILKDSLLPDLVYTVTEPAAEFFANRPRAVEMHSPILPRLLGRQQRSLAEAAAFEMKGALAA